MTEEQAKNNFGLDVISNLLPSGYKVSGAVTDDFTGKSLSTHILYPSDGKVQRVVLVGVGKADKVTLTTIRNATSKAIGAVKDKKITESVGLVVPQNISVLPSPTHGVVLSNVDCKSAVSDSVVLDTITRIAILQNHYFDKYLKSESKDGEESDSKPVNYSALIAANKAVSLGKPFISDLTLLTTNDISDAKSIISKQQIITESTVLARELGNERADEINPEYMERTARAIAKQFGLKVTVVNADELVKQGYNLIAAVGQAARHKSRIVVLEYNGNSSDDQVYAFVGKGITYDTGGLNLKPTGSMEEMHLDMCGSAAVLSTMRAVAQLKLSVNVIGALALAENAIDSLSFKPHAIIQSFKGSVEISNTDAEGRLVLADTMLYVQHHYKPTHIQTIATLTGAIIIALGHNFAGVFSTDDELANSITTSGYTTAEHFWRLPLMHEEHSENTKTSYADSKTTGGRAASSAFAAHWLSKFVDEPVRYAHLDIAGVSIQPKQNSYMCPGGMHERRSM